MALEEPVLSQPPVRRRPAVQPLQTGPKDMDEEGNVRGLRAGLGLKLDVGIDLDSTAGTAVPLRDTLSSAEGGATAGPGLSVTRNQELGKELFGTLGGMGGATAGARTTGSRLEATSYSLGSDTAGKGLVAGGADAPANLSMGAGSVALSFGSQTGGPTIVSDADEANFLALAMGGGDATISSAGAQAGGGGGGGLALPSHGDDDDSDDGVWGPPRGGRGEDFAGDASLGRELGMALDVAAFGPGGQEREDDSDDGLLAAWAAGEDVDAGKDRATGTANPFAGGAGGMGLSFDVEAVNAAAAAAGEEDSDGDLGFLAALRGGSDGEPYGSPPAAGKGGIPSAGEVIAGIDMGEASARGAVDKYDMGEGGQLHLGGKHISERGIHGAAGDVPDPSTSFKNTSVRVGVLGSGASGRVYKVVHVPSLTVVAVKSIPVYDVSKRHRLEEEFKALLLNLTPMKHMRQSAEGSTAGILHDPGRALAAGEGGVTANVTLKQVAPCPFFVSFFNVFTDTKEGTLNFVMEYMDAGSLQDFTAVGPCTSESTLANVSYRILKGLEFLHAHKCIHRDLKPENVLMNHYGHVKLADFGVIRELNASEEMVRTYIGTMFYMSPERIRGEPYCELSDIWSFGMTVLTVAMGHFPLGRKCAYFDLIDKLTEQGPPRLDPSIFSPLAQDFFDQALQLDPANRPSATELLGHEWLLQQGAAQRAQEQEFGIIPPPPPRETVVSKQSMAELDDAIRTVQLYRMTQARRRSKRRLRAVHPSRLIWLAQQTQVPLYMVQYKFKQTTRVINDVLAQKAAADAAQGGGASYSRQSSAVAFSG